MYCLRYTQHGRWCWRHALRLLTIHWQHNLGLSQWTFGIMHVQWPPVPLPRLLTRIWYALIGWWALKRAKWLFFFYDVCLRLSMVDGQSPSPARRNQRRDDQLWTPSMTTVNLITDRMNLLLVSLHGLSLILFSLISQIFLKLVSTFTNVREQFWKGRFLCWLKDLLPKKCVGCRLFTLCSLFVCLFV